MRVKRIRRDLVRPCQCATPDRMRETPDDAADCAYCGGRIPLAIVKAGAK